MSFQAVNHCIHLYKYTHNCLIKCFCYTLKIWEKESQLFSTQLTHRNAVKLLIHKKEELPKNAFMYRLQISITLNSVKPRKGLLTDSWCMGCNFLTEWFLNPFYCQLLWYKVILITLQNILELHWRYNSFSTCHISLCSKVSHFFQTGWTDNMVTGLWDIQSSIRLYSCQHARHSPACSSIDLQVTFRWTTGTNSLTE